MLSSTVTAFLALAASVSAAPQWSNWQGRTPFGGNGWGWGWWAGGPPACLNDTGVAYLINAYTYLLQFPQGENFNATAESILSDQFCVSSDSIDTLAKRPLGAMAYPNKTYFISGQAHTPPMPCVETLETFHTCNKIAWRWNATGLGPNEILGMITMDVDPAALQIAAVYSEFNSGAWLQNFQSPSKSTGGQH